MELNEFLPGTGLSGVEPRPDIIVLSERVDAALRESFLEYVAALVSNDEWYGIDCGFLGFIDDYVQYAALLQRKLQVHGPFTVFDVGCATALQHVVFDPRIRYVGIDVSGPPHPTFFRDNCAFVEGRFADVVEQLGVDPSRDVGIANMSLLYTARRELPVFDATFWRKFVL